MCVFVYCELWAERERERLAVLYVMRHCGAEVNFCFRYVFGRPVTRNQGDRREIVRSVILPCDLRFLTVLPQNILKR